MTSTNSFIEHPRFPDDISHGSRGGPTFATNVVVYGSGYEQRNARWPVARHKYDVAHGLESEAQLATLLKFFHIAQGRQYGFRFKDWADYSASSGSNASGTGQCNSSAVGDGTPHYYLYKKYGPLSGSPGGTTPYGLRRITKPVSGTITVNRNGTAVTLSNSPTSGQAWIDTTTGSVTFVEDFSRAISSLTNNSQALVTTAVSHTLVLSDRVWFQGVAGMTQINSTTAVINSIVDHVRFVVGTDTRTSAGYGVYTGSGQVKKYPQAADVLTAVFEFDVPARFETDEMHTSLDAPGTYSWGQIPVWEIKQG